MSEESRPGVSLDVISRLLVLTPTTVATLASRNVIPKTSRGRYEVDHVVPAYIKYLRSISSRGDAADKNDPKRRLLNAQAEKAEIELATMKGERILLEEVARKVEGEYAAVRANLLALPGEMAPDLEHREAAVIAEMLAVKLEEILGALSADWSAETAGEAAKGETDGAEASSEAEPD